MKIDYKDILKLLSEKPSKQLLSEKLFQLGHEHEINGDIFDMELTPNRGDCISLIGLARDLNVFFGMSYPFEIYKDNIETLEIDFKNYSPSDCPQISFLEIEIDQVTKDYKPYLENYFNSIGGNKTNLFSDISNYISYELGQPTHCYDKDSITGELIFERRECNNPFKTLLGSEVSLEGHNCVFSLNNEIISLAGIMGGASTACSKRTKKVLIECAYFNPESIIGKSVKYNLNSDAAHKFERGVDIASHEMVLRRFAKVVEDHVKIKSIKLKSFSQIEFQNIFLPIDIHAINKILGTSLKDDVILKYLKDLGFEILDKIKIPSYRHDVKTNNDLAEEVARVIGYNKIKSTPINLNKIDHNKDEIKIAKFKSYLTHNGFSEVINFPFTSSKTKNSITIDNPLDSNRKNLRVSLQESLVNNLLYNERRQQDSIKIFEISDIYTKDSVLKQQKKLGIIISGRRGNNYIDFTKKLDFNYLNKLINADISRNLFEIVEIPRNTLNTKKKDKIHYVEINLDDLPNNFLSEFSINEKNMNFINYKPVSEYPSSVRDFSFSIHDLSLVNEDISIIGKISDEIIKHSFIFDFYKNDKTGIVKLGCRFIFQSHKMTLSDLEINNKVNEILTPILKIDGISIPGMHHIDS